VGAYAGLSAVRWEAAAAGLGGASVVALAAGFRRRRASWVPAAVLLSGAAYGVSLVSRDPVFEGASILVAVLLLLVAELGLWSVELAAPVRYEPALLTRRVGLVAALALGSLLSAALVGAAAAQEAERSLVLEAFGVAAAVGVVALFARLARP
jgi:hypothetical protein